MQTFSNSSSQSGGVGHCVCLQACVCGAVLYSQLPPLHSPWCSMNAQLHLYSIGFYSDEMKLCTPFHKMRNVCTNGCKCEKDVSHSISFLQQVSRAHNLAFVVSVCLFGCFFFFFIEKNDERDSFVVYGLLLCICWDWNNKIYSTFF